MINLYHACDVRLVNAIVMGWFDIVLMNRKRWISEQMASAKKLGFATCEVRVSARVSLCIFKGRDYFGVDELGEVQEKLMIPYRNQEKGNEFYAN